MAPRMHEDQIDVDIALVRDLLGARHPQFAHLPISAVRSTGTENALSRLGGDAVARLPLRPSAAHAIVYEATWLPVLAPQLPLPVPVPLAVGSPSERFPWPWLVEPWFDGEDAASACFDAPSLALDIATFVCALHVVDTEGGPPPARGR